MKKAIAALAIAMAATAAGCGSSTTETQTVTVAASPQVETVVKTVTSTTAETAPAAGRSRSFSGNGSKTLPPVKLPSGATLKWTNDDADGFAIYSEAGVPVSSDANRGETFIEAGTHTFEIDSYGNWTIKIVEAEG